MFHNLFSGAGSGTAIFREFARDLERDWVLKEGFWPPLASLRNGNVFCVFQADFVEDWGRQSRVDKKWGITYPRA